MPPAGSKSPVPARSASPAPVQRSKASSAANGGATVAADASTKPFIPDMNKPIVWQVGSMDVKTYVKWVHTPFVYKGEPDRVARFFASSFLEAFSRTPWWLIPLFWTPVVFYLATPGWQAYGALRGGVLTACGFMLWTIIEYSLHRWVFHLDARLPDHPLAIWFHFLMHGVHHRIPNDRWRLVMPVALSVPLCAFVWSVWRGLLMPNAEEMTFRAMFAGAVVGYICYDMMHYFSHHGWKLTPGTWIFNMRKYHMKHHWQDDGYMAGFGITSMFWDRVFGTVLKIKA